MVYASGREALLEVLLQHGVEYVFGNPGSTEAPFMVALEGYPRLKYVLGLQESAVAGMADGYARAAGRVGFVNLHVATGLANGICGLYNAHRGGTPLVVTAGQSDSRLFQEDPAIHANLVEMTRPFTKLSAEVLHAADVPLVMRRAFKVALEPPTGPVFVSLPMDVLDRSAEFGALDLAPPPPAYNRPRPDAVGVERAAELLAEARRPMLAVGDRLAQSGGVAEAVALAETLGATVWAIDPSELVFPTDHPLYAGAITPWSTFGRGALREADVVLAIGATLFRSFMYERRDALGPETTLIHLDSDDREVGRIYPAAVGLAGDPRAGLSDLGAALEARLTPAAHQAARERLARRVASAKTEASARAPRAGWESVPIAPRRLAAEIGASLPAGCVFVDEALTMTPPLREAVKFREPGSYFSHRGGGIGWGVGAAVGVSLARPDRRTVAVIGDGSSLYSIQGLWTAARLRLPITYVICANRSYRILKLNVQRYLADNPAGAEQPASSDYLGTDIVDPSLDHVALAAGFGVPGRRVERPEEIGPALRWAHAQAGPALVEVVIDGGV